KKKIQPLLEVPESDKSLDVALLGALIEMLIDFGSTEYANATHLDEAEAGLKEVLLDQARKVYSRLGGDVTLTSSSTFKVDLAAKTISAPPIRLAEITQPVTEITSEERNKLDDTIETFQKFREALITDLQNKEKLYKIQWDKIDPTHEDFDKFKQQEGKL